MVSRLFKKYRIIEVKDSFIPQRRDITGWRGIDRTDYFLWYIIEDQLKYCSFGNIESAKARIVSYKEQDDNNKHKVVSKVVYYE